MSQYSWDLQTMRLLVIRRCTDVQGTKQKNQKKHWKRIKRCWNYSFVFIQLIVFSFFYFDFIICAFYEFETTMSIYTFIQTILTNVTIHTGPANSTIACYKTLHRRSRHTHAHTHKKKRSTERGIVCDVNWYLWVQR